MSNRMTTAFATAQSFARFFPDGECYITLTDGHGNEFYPDEAEDAGLIDIELFVNNVGYHVYITRESGIWRIDDQSECATTLDAGWGVDASDLLLAVVSFLAAN